MGTRLKIILIIIIVLLGAAAGAWVAWELQANNYNELIDQVKENLEAEKQQVASKKDSVVQVRDQTIKNLISENEKAKADSRYWYNQAKKRSVNPDYDIDFITAADVLAKSEYKPGE